MRWGPGPPPRRVRGHRAQCPQQAHEGNEQTWPLWASANLAIEHMSMKARLRGPGVAVCAGAAATAPRPRPRPLPRSCRTSATAAIAAWSSDSRARKSSGWIARFAGFTAVNARSAASESRWDSKGPASSRPLAANSVRMREKATPVKAKVNALAVETWLRAAGSLKVSGPPHVRMASPIGTEAV